jgi:hypothetical protein
MVRHRGSRSGDTTNRLLPVADIHQRADEADSLLDGVPFPGISQKYWAAAGAVTAT